MQNFGYCVLAFTVATLGGCAASDPEAAAMFHGSDTAAAEQAIYRGSSETYNAFSAAVYSRDTSHGGGIWGQITCSGTVLRHSAGVSWVLTARHCLTVDGTISGATKNVTDLRLSAALNPGILMTTSVAAAAAFVSNIYAMPAPTNDPKYDIAVLRVSQDFPLDTTHYPKFALNPGPSGAPYPSKSLNAWGYGQYVVSSNITATMAGVLRMGRGFSGAPAVGKTYTFANSSPAENTLHSMDAGGAMADYFKWSTPSGRYEWYTLDGIFQGTVNGVGTAVDVAGMWDWLQMRLGYVYLAPPYDYANNLAIATEAPTVGAALALGVAGDSARTRWLYQSTTGTLKSGSSNGLCVEGSGTSVSLQNCTGGPAQQWDLVEVQGTRVLRNHALGTCITSSAIPGLATCGTNDLTLLFKSQP